MWVIIKNSVFKSKAPTSMPLQRLKFLNRPEVAIENGVKVWARQIVDRV